MFMVLLFTINIILKTGSKRNIQSNSQHK